MFDDVFIASALTLVTVLAILGYMGYYGYKHILMDEKKAAAKRQ